MDRESQAALVLHFYKELSPSNILQLYQRIGSLTGIFESSNWLDTWPMSLCQKLEYLDRQKELLEEKANGVLSWCEGNHVSSLSITHSDYPPLLREIASPPIMLFVQGDVDLLGLPASPGLQRLRMGRQIDADEHPHPEHHLPDLYSLRCHPDADHSNVRADRY